jgi:hypothetical protein
MIRISINKYKPHCIHIIELIISKRETQNLSCGLWRNFQIIEKFNYLLTGDDFIYIKIW